MTRRLADAVKAAAAALALLALVIGVPVALATAVGWPLPTSVPTAASMQDVTLLGVPGTRTFTSSSTEVIDRYRGGDR